MSWNRPQETAAAGKKPAKRAGSKSLSPAFKGALALVLVCVIGAVVFLLVSGGEEKVKESKKVKATGMIETVTPAKARSVDSPVEEKASRVVVTNEFGIPLLPNGKPSRLFPEPAPSKYGVTTTNVSRLNQEIEVRTFKQPTDMQIAFMMNAELGDEFGDGLDTRNFTYNFLKSLETPIVIEPEDDEEVRNLKQLVIDTRKELKERYDRGEDIEHVVEDTIAELQRLGRYKTELQKQLDELSRDPTMTEEQMNDYLEAANKMLEEKGIGVMTLNGAIQKRVKRNELKMKRNRN